MRWRGFQDRFGELSGLGNIGIDPRVCCSHNISVIRSAVGHRNFLIAASKLGIGLLSDKNGTARISAANEFETTAAISNAFGDYRIESILQRLVVAVADERKRGAIDAQVAI